MRGGPRANVVVLPRQGKTLLDERLHFLQVALQLFLGVAVTQEISAQPHARDRGLKIVRDRRQNLDPFRSLLGNASLHGVERGSGARHFLRTILRERFTAQIRSQAVGRALEARQRLRRELHGNPGEECEKTELNRERRRQPARNARSQLEELDQQRATVLETNAQSPLRSLRWIQVDPVQVVVGPRRGYESRDDSFPWRPGMLDWLRPTASESVPPFGSIEAIEPNGSFFGLHLFEDSDRTRSVLNEIVNR